MKKAIPKIESPPLFSTQYLPSENDFDPFGGCLDAQWAWKNFGGLDLDSAYRKFCENPASYQEDFMFMGPKAFEYYFPVVDRYLRETSNSDDLEDGEAWILGKAIGYQLDTPVAEELLKCINELCRYVRSHLSQYTPSVTDQKRIDEAWALIERSFSIKRDNQPY